jgi:hypothetical protein
MSELENSLYDLFHYIRYGVQDCDVENYREMVKIIMKNIKKLIKETDR